MKTIPGTIRITDKVYFEYYKKEEPDGYVPDGYTLSEERFEEQMKAYEASKQLVEVSNESYPVTNTTNGIWILLEKIWKVCKDGQSCKAEIKDNKATIIELIK